MRPNLDLRPGRVMLALGAVGLGSSLTADPAAAAAAPPSPTATVGTAAGGLIGIFPAPFDRLDTVLGGALAPLLAPSASPSASVSMTASTGPRDLLVGQRVSVQGSVRPGGGGRVVAVQERRARSWLTVARGATSTDGRYRLGFRAPATGSLVLRVRLAGDRLIRPAVRALGVVSIYRLAAASWYGPGGPLACGGTLTDSKLGVANRTLPCGTIVGLHLGHRTVRVPVIDRGPFVAGREYDLTPATKRALGFGDIGKLWVTR